MIVFLFILLFGPVLFMALAWPVSLIVEKRGFKKSSTQARYLSISIWPYIFYGSLIPIWLTLWIPSWLIYLLLPDVVASIVMLIIWLLALLLEAGLFFCYAPAWFSKTLSWTKTQTNFLSVVLLVPYLALIFYVFSEISMFQNLFTLILL